MSVMVERPYPVDFVHPNGKRAKIDFIWGMPDNPAPVGIRVWGREGHDDILLARESWSWKSFDEALRRGIRLATNWCERGNA
ncbi:hypothetical protein [Pseudomonas akapageensis]|uniref:hypothetical protein n=1 Tax=Pseudomonas akapageensis TaxID=2609961 RepID=UPI001408C077|nr:hypothetical protein [Pseudomonas akapageensis]